MSDTKETMTEALRHLAEALRKAQGGEPPTVEELLALREGKLEGENRLDLERRLSVDPQAVDELLDLTKFSRLEPPTPEHHLSDEDQARALSSLRKRLGIEGHEPRQGVDEEGAGDPGESAHEGFSRSLGRWRIFALAAALLAVVAGTWAFRLERRLETERDPRFAAVIDVHATRGEERPVEMAGGEQAVLLIFHDLQAQRLEHGVLELADAAGNKLLRRNLASTPAAGSLLYFSVPSALLPLGAYRVGIYEERAGSRTLLQEYAFALVSSED